MREIDETRGVMKDQSYLRNLHLESAHTELHCALHSAHLHLESVSGTIVVKKNRRSPALMKCAGH